MDWTCPPRSMRLQHWCGIMSRADLCGSQLRGQKVEDSWLGSGWYWDAEPCFIFKSWTWSMKAMELSGITGHLLPKKKNERRQGTLKTLRDPLNTFLGSWDYFHVHCLQTTSQVCAVAEHTCWIWADPPGPFFPSLLPNTYSISYSHPNQACTSWGRRGVSITCRQYFPSQYSFLLPCLIAYVWLMSNSCSLSHHFGQEAFTESAADCMLQLCPPSLPCCPSQDCTGHAPESTCPWWLPHHINAHCLAVSTQRHL